MKRYVSVKRSAAGATTVTVSLVDGELSASWATKTYTGQVATATKQADQHAHRAMDAIRQGIEEVEQTPSATV